MRNPTPADGHPIPAGLVATVDESIAELQGGVTYVLAAVIFVDATAARKDIQALTTHRTRPLHWHREGPENRMAAIEHIKTHAATTKTLARRAARHAQTKTRARLLHELVAELASESVGHVIIESRGPREDGRDRSVILDSFRDTAATSFTYDWRTKSEPLLWYADALAGVAREYLTAGISADFRDLQKAQILGDIRYVT